MADPRELADQAFALLQDALRESEARAAELREELERRRSPEGSVGEQIDKLRQQLDEAEHERTRLVREIGRLEDVLAEERAKAEQLKAKLEVAESGPDKLTTKEINYWRAKIDDLDRAGRDQKTRLAELRRELKERDERLDALTESERRAVDAEASARQRADELVAENGKLRSQLDEAERRIESLEQEAGARLEAEERFERETAAARAESDRLRDTLGERESRIAQLSAEIEAVKAELSGAVEQRERLNAELEQARQSLAAELDEREQTRQALAAELESAREQIAGLEQELRDEKECTDNLSEVANERREIITRLEDRLAEAEERYEEARWRLSKAQHFERLVIRRKRLIRALIERIRAKDKANTALKAGLDGLRKYKATAEAKQHELLARIDRLKARIKEQEETIARHHGATLTEAQLEASRGRIAELEKRIEDQIHVIQTLEEELKTAKALQQVRAEAGSEIERLRGEVERLRRELETKDQLVAKLENDSDEQQRKIAKLRGAETETMRLKQKLEEQETTIARLNEAVDGWRRKYEFMTAETPSAYRSAAEK